MVKPNGGINRFRARGSRAAHVCYSRGVAGRPRSRPLAGSERHAPAGELPGHSKRTVCLPRLGTERRPSMQCVFRSRTKRRRSTSSRTRCSSLREIRSRPPEGTAPSLPAHPPERQSATTPAKPGALDLDVALVVLAHGRGRRRRSPRDVRDRGIRQCPGLPAGRLEQSPTIGDHRGGGCSPLPQRQRQAFLLRYWKTSISVKRLGAMGCSEGSVKRRIAPGRRTRWRRS